MSNQLSDADVAGMDDGVGGIDAGEIRAALENILADERLRMSERNRRFLRFVVEETLAGRSECIKSYTIAVDVFGRPPTFDAIADPIVRIEATRMRAALTDFYRKAFRAGGLRIDIPKGSYVPVFVRSAPEGARMPKKRLRLALDIWHPATALSAAAAALAGLAMAAVFSGLLPWASRAETASTSIAVEAVRSASAGGEEIARGVTESIIVRLSNFPGIRVLHIREGRASTDSAPLADAPLYVLQSTLRGSGTSMRFWWGLYDAHSNEVIWSEYIDHPLENGSAQTIEDRIAARVATRIAEPGGIVETRDAAGRAPGTN